MPLLRKAITQMRNVPQSMGARSMVGARPTEGGLAHSGDHGPRRWGWRQGQQASLPYHVVASDAAQLGRGPEVGTHWKG